MDILTLGLGLELGRQDISGLKNTGVNFLASGRSRQDVADPFPLVTAIESAVKWLIFGQGPFFFWHRH